MHFTPGSDVTRGELLFVIEPSLYQARVDQAAADLASAEAQLEAAAQQLAITRAIFERNAGSRTELVQKTQARDQAQAAVAQTRARLDAARLDLSYTRIYAPNSGRIDRNYVDVGNLVGAGEATLLAAIVRQDPIYAYFDMSERDVLVYRALRRRGRTVAAEGEPNKAFMALATDEGFPRKGTVDYVSNQVDPATGTLEARAVFANSEGVIVPGLFVRIRLPFTRGRALLVPEEAVLVDQGGRYVLAVDDQNVVQHRRVEIGPLDAGMRVVERGVARDDRIVVNGTQRARPGSPVTPLAAPAVATATSTPP
jgi:RND family efflux transporter MFP subunit